MDSRLECPVDLANTVRGEKKDALPLYQILYKVTQLEYCLD